MIQIGGVLVRLGVMQGEYQWHEHDEQDEFFFVVDGVFRIELEDRDSVELTRGQGFCVGPGRSGHATQLAFDRWAFLPRVMSGPPCPATATRFLGVELARPVLTVDEVSWRNPYPP